MQAQALQIIFQRSIMDCAVACLAMLTGVAYEEALIAFKHNVCAVGASQRQIIAAAKRLKVTLTFSKRKVDLENDIGILQIGAGKWKADHVVLLKEGQIVDTDSTLWDADVFLSTYKAYVVGIYTIKEG